MPIPYFSNGTVIVSLLIDIILNRHTSNALETCTINYNLTGNDLFF